jgi:hypothetical protein
MKRKEIEGTRQDKMYSAVLFRPCENVCTVNGYGSEQVPVLSQDLRSRIPKAPSQKFTFYRVYIFSILLSGRAEGAIGSPSFPIPYILILISQRYRC